MTEPQNQPPPPPPRPTTEIGNGKVSSGSGFPGQKAHFPNPPESTNPDPATLREQWRFAIRQYSRWYSQAWGSAILAGISFFALGWVIKGGNPLPSLQGDPRTPSSDEESKDAPR